MFSVLNKGVIKFKKKFKKVKKKYFNCYPVVLHRFLLNKWLTIQFEI